MSKKKEYKIIQGYAHITRQMVEMHAGKKIASIEVSDVRLTVLFEGGDSLCAEDMGQDCCEERYMRTDDDVESFVGSSFVGVVLREGPCTGHPGDMHTDVQFLEVLTSGGPLTVSSYNDHNGYYGGFDVVLS